MADQRHAPAALPHLKETSYSFYRRLGGRVLKISLTMGFDPRTVQPVASRKEIMERNTVIGCSPEVMQRNLSRKICAALDR